MRIYLNLIRQLAWRGIPRIGKALTMNFYGQPNAAWILSLSIIAPPGGGVGSPPQAVQPGETWHPGPTRNFTDAVSVTFL